MIDLHTDIDINTLPEKTAKQKIDDINKVAEFFCNQKSYDESLYCSEYALLMAETIDYTKGIAGAKRNIGEVHYNKSEFKDAVIMLTEAAKLFAEIQDKNNEGKAYINLAISHRYLDDYTIMIELCFKALNIFRETNDEFNEGYILTIIGNYYLEVREYDLSIEYYTMALKIQRKQKNIRRIILVIYNIGLAYYNFGIHSAVLEERNFFFEKCLKYYQLALTFNIEIDKRIFFKYRISRNIAMAYGSQQNYEEAEKIFLDCLRHFRATDNKLETCETLTDLGDMYVNATEDDKAIEVLREAEILAVELESKRLQLAVSWKFNTMFKNKRDYKNALFYSKKLTPIEFERRKTLVENNIRKLDIIHKVDITKKETEILSEQNEQLKFLNDELLQMNKGKNHFLNLAANDLKIPLENISELINVVKKNNLERAKKTKMLQEILNHSSNMQKIISELLIINEVETAKQTD